MIFLDKIMDHIQNNYKIKILITYVIILSLLIVFNLTIISVYAFVCNNLIWEIGEDINNCPQDANEYSLSPSPQLNVLNILNNIVGMYIFPDWHKPTINDLIAQWQPIMNATSSYHFLQEQPKKPILNYYDDTNPIVARWTIKWALEHGVNLFVYDWYDWNYTEAPLDVLLNEFDNYYLSYKNKARFALMWANHDVPTTTVGVLEKLDRAEMKYFRHSQYFKINNQPVFMIFNLQSLFDVFGVTGTNDLLIQMKNRIKEKGYEGLYIVFNGDCNNLSTTTLIAFDAVTAYNYSNIADVRAGKI